MNYSQRNLKWRWWCCFSGGKNVN